MFRYIKAIGSSRSDVIERIDNTSMQICENMFKLMMFSRTCTTGNHWKTELFAALNRIPTLKSKKKKYLKKRDILEALHRNADASYDYWAYVSEKGELELTIDGEFDLEVAKSIIDSYFDWIATKLSERGAISREDCYNLVDELLDEYFTTIGK